MTALLGPIFPRLSRVSCFPALFYGYEDFPALANGFHVFLVRAAGFIFTRAFHKFPRFLELAPAPRVAEIIEGPLYPFVKLSHVRMFGLFMRHK